MLDRAESVLTDLLDGNRRFREGRPRGYRYAPHQFTRMTQGQAPTAAIITCSDSRVAPDVVFDTSLGTLLVGRVPGNVASESTRWLVDMAVAELNVPLVLVVGHTHCRAVQQILEGKPSDNYEPLQVGIQIALERAQKVPQPDLYRQVIIENIRHTVEDLRQEPTLRVALANARTDIAGALYDIQSGEIQLLDA